MPDPEEQLNEQSLVYWLNSAGARALESVNPLRLVDVLLNDRPPRRSSPQVRRGIWRSCWVHDECLLSSSAAHVQAPNPHAEPLQAQI